MDRAVLEYPQVRAGLIFCLDRSFSPGAERDHRRQGDRLAQPRGRRHRHRRPGGGRASASPTTPTSIAECRRAGLGLTVHAGETGGADEVRAGGRGAGAGPHRPRRPQRRRPERARHAARAGHRAGGLPDARTSTPGCCARTPTCAVWSGPCVDGGVRFTVSTDGPEMLRTVPSRRAGNADAPRDPLARRGPPRDRDRRASELPRPRAGHRDAPSAGREPAGNGHAPIPVEVGS